MAVAAALGYRLTIWDSAGTATVTTGTLTNGTIYNVDLNVAQLIANTAGLPATPILNTFEGPITRVKLELTTIGGTPNGNSYWGFLKA